MILTNTVELLISNQNLDYYKSLGYGAEYGKKLAVLVEHLPTGSHYNILAKCDGCGKEVSIQYRSYKAREDNSYYCPQCSLLLTLDPLNDFTGLDIRLLRKYFINKTNHTCSICGTRAWQEQYIPLILDHIDGNSDNWARKNLRMVCPNCDSLLPTWKGRNRGHGRTNRRKK